MEAEIYRFIIRSRFIDDPRSSSLLSDTRSLGMDRVNLINCQDIFYLAGNLSDSDLSLLGTRLLSDPITQEFEVTKFAGQNNPKVKFQTGEFIVEVALHPGVTDPVAEQIIRASHVLGVHGVTHAATGHRYVLQGELLDEEYIHIIACRLLSNPTIQSYSIGYQMPVFPELAASSGSVEILPIRNLPPEELLKLSVDRRAALNVQEMLAIQTYFQKENRDITDLEFETIAQTWSEHCVHKTFRAYISIQNPQDGDPRGRRDEKTINNLLKTYLRSATELIHPRWLRSAFVDNAGIIEFDVEYEVSFKVETHNHPSAIEPFGGANTGVGGVIRDVIGVSAKPIAATDVLCFGPPDTQLEDLPTGVLHPRKIRSGVISGVQDYGNKIGIPTVSGAILYDSGFTANPLVFCGCVGIAPKDSHPRDPLPGDRVIVLGGRTGRDGLRGATFSSMTMDAQTGQVAGASVQIGAPIVEKGLIDVIMKARDDRLYHAITDCGAGGLSSAVGEMASTLGADVDLAKVRLKYSGLAPWEIWLSEAQERMVLAVPKTALPQLQELCDIFEVELTDIGEFTGFGRLVVRYKGEVQLNLENNFLHDGLPQRKLVATLPRISVEAPVRTPDILNYTKVLWDLLSHPDIASKEDVVRLYDHGVQGATVIKPFTGIAADGPSDSVVIKPALARGSTAIILGAGINPEYGKTNPYRMTLSVIDEAIRNIVAVGGDPDRTALLDNFCWGDPKNPETMGTLVEAARGCYDAAIYYRSPFISGKDSLNNEYMGTDGKRHAIPSTLLISSISVIPDFDKTVTMDLKTPGSPVFLVGDFQPRLEGSHFSLVTGIHCLDGIPDLPLRAPEVYRTLFGAIGSGWVAACHDLSEGGLLTAAAEMCIGGRLGLDLELTFNQPALAFFGQTNGCLLVEVFEDSAALFSQAFSGLPIRRVGTVTSLPVLVFSDREKEKYSVPVEKLVRAWKGQQEGRL